MKKSLRIKAPLIFTIFPTPLARILCAARAKEALDTAGRPSDRPYLAAGDPCGSGLVLGLVDQLVLGDPRHHGAQLGADFLDRMFCSAPAHGFEARLAGGIFEHPVA